MANPSVVVDFVANTQKLASGIKELGGASGQAGAEVKKVDWKRIALWGGAAVALGAGVKFMKDSVKQTTDLAKATMQLQRVTGMDTGTASAWVEVAKSRGIEVGTLTKSFTILSKQMNAASTGSKKSADAFKQLGVNMEDVRKGNTQAVLMQVSDGLSKMQNPAKRAALTQQLFGRSSEKLTPLLYKGSGAIQEQLDMAKKYGATLGDKTTKQVADMAANQREMGIAMDGVKIKLGTALMPVLLELSQVLVEIVRVMQPILSSGLALKILLGTIAVAMVAMKVATVAATIAQLGLDASMLPMIAIAAAVIVAIIALIAIGVLLWKNWDKISAGMSAAWGVIKAGALDVINWLKANWPLILGILAGPLGLAVALVVTHWNRVKSITVGAWQAVVSGVSSAIGSIRSVITSFANWMGGALTPISAALSKMSGWWSGPLNAVHSMVSGIKSAINGLISWFSDAVARIGATASHMASAIKAPINALIGAWNGLAFTLPTVTIPKFAGVKVKGKEVIPGFGGEKFGGQSFPFPKIPRLAEGGVFDYPTLAIVGEGQGREIVTPESLLRSMISSIAPEVHVYIGDTELRDLVRVEVVDSDNRTAATLLGGLA